MKKVWLVHKPRTLAGIQLKPELFVDPFYVVRETERTIILARSQENAAAGIHRRYMKNDGLHMFDTEVQALDNLAVQCELERIKYQQLADDMASLHDDAIKAAYHE